MKIYKEIEINSVSELNELSKKGWNVVSVYPQSYSISQVSATVQSLHVIISKESVFDHERIKKDIFNQIKSIILDQGYPCKLTISESSSFEELGVDSLDMVEMLMKLEQEYDINFNEYTRSFIYIIDVIDYIINTKYM